MVKIKLNLPDYVYPLGVMHKVLVVDKVDSQGSAGETAPELRQIKIDSDQDTRRRWTTLLHEYMHASLAVCGVSSVINYKIEEIIVQTLEHSIEQFLLQFGQQIVDALSVQKED